MIQSFPTFELQFKVRDYECDMEGIVNNAIYQNYLEHTRHEMLISRGISFTELLEQKIVPVIARADIRYKQPLRSGDEFVVTCQTAKEGPRILFYQKIFRLPERKLCTEASITGAITINGKLVINSILDKYL